MASVAKNVALSFGLISTSVTVESAVASKAKSGNVMVCDTGHEPTQIRSPRVCDTCGELHGDFGEVPFQQLKKARPVEGGFVVLDKEDLAAASEDLTRFKKKASVTAHPAEQVGMLTSTGEKMYYLVPEPGHGETYATLLALVTSHPELAFATQWVPRSAASIFQLIAYDGVLALQERVSGSGLKPVPQVELTVNNELVGLAEQVLALPASVSDFDLATYKDSFEERIAAIVSGKKVVAVAGAKSSEATNAPSVVDLMEKLREQAAPKKKPSTPKKASKPRAKKVSA